MVNVNPIAVAGFAAPRPMAWARDGAHTPLPSVPLSRVVLQTAINRVRKDKTSPLAITYDGKKQVVLMSPHYFRQMAKIAHYPLAAKTEMETAAVADKFAQLARRIAKSDRPHRIGKNYSVSLINGDKSKTVALKKSGEKEAILIPIGEYRSLAETAFLYRDKSLAKEMLAKRRAG